MKRSISVTLVGIFAFLGSLLTLALGVVMAVALAVSRTSNAAMRAPGARVVGMVGLAFLVLPSTWGVATGIGIFFLKRWARVSIIVFGAFLVLGGFFGGLILLVMPLPSTGPTGVGSFGAIKMGIGVFYLLTGAIGLWWALLFSSRSVKMQFAGGQLITDGMDKPVSISIIAWLLILGSAFIPFSIVMRLPMAFLGWLLTGWTAAFVFALFAAFQLYIGIGSLRLNARSRVLAIYYSIFGAVNGVLIYALPGREARMATMMKAMPAYFHQPTPTVMPFPYWLFEVMILVFMLIQIYFLITRKPAFRP
jgi:hypothetical protein